MCLVYVYIGESCKLEHIYDKKAPDQQFDYSTEISYLAIVWRFKLLPQAIVNYIVSWME